MKKVLCLQPPMRRNLTLPYPYYVDEDGNILKQKIWRGAPAKFCSFHEKPSFESSGIEWDLRKIFARPSHFNGWFAALEYGSDSPDCEERVLGGGFFEKIETVSVQDWD